MRETESTEGRVVQRLDLLFGGGEGYDRKSTPKKLNPPLISTSLLKYLSFNHPVYVLQLTLPSAFSGNMPAYTPTCIVAFML